MVDKKTLIGYLDATPKWSEIVDMLVDMAHNGTVEQVGTAHNELRRMARAADAYVAVQKCISELAKIGEGGDAAPQGGISIKHAESPVLGSQNLNRGGA